MDWLALALAWLLQYIIMAAGALAVWAVGYFIWLAQYNEFISSPVVVQGWSVVRDISNMFFVLVLLIISFGTILHVQQYQMKTLLPKVLLMAVLVNFSKAIAGIFIDFAQVVMLTFVAAFSSIGAGNFLDVIGLKGIASIRPNDVDVTAKTIIGTYIVATLMSLVAVVVVGAFLVILVVRMVMLWVLIVFSPLAYVLSVVPMGQKYAQQWWDTFAKYLIVGPVMAFFLWLSLATLPGITGQGKHLDLSKASVEHEVGSDEGFEKISQISNPTITEVGSASQMAAFVVSTAMLLMSLIFAQQVGGAVGKIAGNAYGRITNAGSRMALAPWRLTQGAARGAGAMAIGGLSRNEPLRDYLARNTGRGFGIGRLYTRAYGALRRPQQRLEEEAEREAKLYNDPRVLQAIMRRRSVTPYARALREAVEKRSPSSIDTDADFNRYMSNPRRKPSDFSNLSQAEWVRIGRRALRMGLGPGPRFTPGAAFNQFLSQGGNGLERGILSAYGVPVPVTAPGTGRRLSTIPFAASPAIEADAATHYRAKSEVGRIDSLKLSATQQKITDAGGDAKKFFTSDEYKNNRDQYLGEEEYNEHERGEATARLQPATSAGTLQAGTVIVQGEQVHVGGAMAMPFPKNSLGKVSGAQSLLARGTRDGYARMAVDFKKLQDAGLREDVHGANIGVHDKQRVVGALDQGTGKWSGIMGELQKEGKYSDRELQQLHRDLTNAKGLTLLNKGAGDARGTIAHEAIHDRLNTVDPNELRNMWGSLSDSQKEDAKNEIHKQWGPNFRDDQVMHEYFAEGLTKASQYGDKSNVKIDLPQSILDKFVALGVVAKKTVTAGKGEEKTERTVYNPTNLFRKKTPIAEAAAAPAPERATALHEELEEEAPDVAHEMEEEATEAPPPVSRGTTAAIGGPETPAFSRSLFGMDPIMRKAFRDLTFQMHELAKSQRINALRVDELTGHIDKLANRAVSEHPTNPLAAKAHDEEILSELKKIEGSLGSEGLKGANDKGVNREAA